MNGVNPRNIDPIKIIKPSNELICLKFISQKDLKAFYHVLMHFFPFFPPLFHFIPPCLYYFPPTATFPHNSIGFCINFGLLLNSLMSSKNS